MPTRLTEAEREERRRERNRRTFSDAAYRHYDPYAAGPDGTTVGYGDPGAWADAVWAALGGQPGARVEPELVTRRIRLLPEDIRSLDVLGLVLLPADYGALKSAFRAACLLAHPDTGGSEQAIRAVYAAFERLAKLLAD